MNPGDGDNVSKVAGRIGWSGNRLFHLFLSALVAVAFWALYNLSQDYSVFLNYELLVRTNIEGRQSSAFADERVMVKVRASGFYIISQRSGIRDVSVELNLDKSHLNHPDASSDVFQLNLQDVQNDLVSSFPPQVTVESVVSGTVNIPIHKVSSRKVPVVLSYSLVCDPQYEMAGLPVLTPDSVLISGDAATVASVNAIHTENVSISGASSDVQGMAGLHTPKGISVSVPGVVWYLAVERYVEESVTLPVAVRDVPFDRKVIVLPDEVKVTCRHVFPLTGGFEMSDAVCSVDYEQLVHSVSSELIPDVVFPDGMEVFSTKLYPPVVQFVILEN